jgi:molecular chaperone GrpE
MEKKEKAVEETEEATKGTEDSFKAAPEKGIGREGAVQEKEAMQEGKGHEGDAGRNELEELRDSLQRLQAEFENSRKRLEREKQDFAMLANAALVKELLPLIDSIDAAERHLKERENVPRDDALKGMELVKKQLLAVLGAHGLYAIECVGKQFDPMLEDCIMQGFDEKKGDGIVLEELQRGYALNGRVLRHAKVKVNRAPEKEEPAGPKGEPKKNGKGQGA